MGEVANDFRASRPYHLATLQLPRGVASSTNDRFWTTRQRLQFSCEAEAFGVRKPCSEIYCPDLRCFEITDGSRPTLTRSLFNHDQFDRERNGLSVKLGFHTQAPCLRWFDVMQMTMRQAGGRLMSSGVRKRLADLEPGGPETCTHTRLTTSEPSVK